MKTVSKSKPKLPTKGDRKQWEPLKNQVSVSLSHLSIKGNVVQFTSLNKTKGQYLVP